MRIQFADYVLDTAARELRRRGQVAPLSPKAYGLLEALVERRPRAVAHAELRSLLWPDTIAGGTTLARLVNEVRVALGDRAQAPRFVRTVHRFGYSFCATATDEPTSEHISTTHYMLQWGTRYVPLPRGENIIGRAADLLVTVPSSKVSRRHARIVVAEGGVTLEDLGSKNGTRVGDERINGLISLRDGDRIVIGPVLLIFRATLEDSTSTQAST